MQEGIREGMAIRLWLEFGGNICPQCKSWELCTHQQRYLDASDYLMSHLHSQGVVVKAERGLPYECVCGRWDFKVKDGVHNNECYGHNKYIKTGYEAIEPLIKRR